MKISQTRLIVLDKLMISAENARQTPTSAEADAELKASIKAHGLKQNLVVHQVGDVFHVHAGGRRLKALQQLAEDGDLKANHKVACRIEEGESAQETSLAENIIRTAMHPADEYLAFTVLQDKGLTVEEIATRFGITNTHIRQRLKLGRVALDILEAYRGGHLSLESVMAFTLCDDHSRQLRVFQALSSEHRLYAPTIRRVLTETSCSANSQLARFVGLDAYRAAGGTVIEDLFSDDESTYLEDIDLLECLARTKLQEKASELSKDWKWAEAMLETNYDSFKHFGRIYPKDLPLDAYLQEEYEQLRERASELEAKYDEESWSEALQEEEDKTLARLQEIEAFDENNVEYSLDQKVISGCIVTLNHAGDMRIEAGLVRPEDIPSSAKTLDKTLDEDEGEESSAKTSDLIIQPPAMTASRAATDPVTIARKEQGISLLLAEELRAARHQILQAHLAADYATASDIMLYSMARHILDDHNVQPIEVSLKKAETYRVKDMLKDTVAAGMLETLYGHLNLNWMGLDKGEAFKALCALSDDDKQALFSWCVAYALNQQLSTDKDAHPVIEIIGERMGVDVAQCWRPSADTYWGRVKKDYALNVAREQIGNNWATNYVNRRKTYIAKAMEGAFSEDPQGCAGLMPEIAAKTSTWLPDGMGFNVPEPHIDREDLLIEAADSETEPEKVMPADDEPSSLPAFLTNTV